MGWFCPLDRAVSHTISFYGRVTNASLGLLTQEAIWPLAVSQTISIWLSDKIARVAQPFPGWLLTGKPLFPQPDYGLVLSVGQGSYLKLFFLNNLCFISLET